MRAPPDAVANPPRSPATSAGSVREFLTRVGRRRTAILAAEGAAAGFVMASVVALVIWLARGPSPGAILLGAGLVIAGIAARVTWSASDRTRLAEVVERRALGCRNVIVTA